MLFGLAVGCASSPQLEAKSPTVFNYLAQGYCVWVSPVVDARPMSQAQHKVLRQTADELPTWIEQHLRRDIEAAGADQCSPGDEPNLIEVVLRKGRLEQGNNVSGDVLVDVVLTGRRGPIFAESYRGVYSEGVNAEQKDQPVEVLTRTLADLNQRVLSAVYLELGQPNSQGMYARRY